LVLSIVPYYHWVDVTADEHFVRPVAFKCVILEKIARIYKSIGQDETMGTVSSEKEDVPLSEDTANNPDIQI
jgi:hypothetical protein